MRLILFLLILLLSQISFAKPKKIFKFNKDSSCKVKIVFYEYYRFYVQQTNSKGLPCPAINLIKFYDDDILLDQFDDGDKPEEIGPYYVGHGEGYGSKTIYEHANRVEIEYKPMNFD